MRIHFNTNSEDTLRALHSAQEASGVTFEKMERHASRSARLAYEVILSGDSTHRINSSEFGREFAASWDQWGIFMAVIYEADPYATSWAYGSAQDFHHKTAFRFGSGGVTSMNDPEYRRTSHKWSYVCTGLWECTGHGKSNPTCTAELVR